MCIGYVKYSFEFRNEFYRPIFLIYRRPTAHNFSSTFYLYFMHTFSGENVLPPQTKLFRLWFVGQFVKVEVIANASSLPRLPSHP